MQKKVMAHCLRVQFFLANPVYSIKSKLEIETNLVVLKAQNLLKSWLYRALPPRLACFMAYVVRCIYG